MKCGENGGCPINFHLSICPRICNYGDISHTDDCHLRPVTDFPIIKAMIVGEWKCSTCKDHEGLKCGRIGVYEMPCNSWQPRTPERE